MRVAGAVLGLGLALLAGSARADWKDGEPVPAGYHVERSSKTRLWVGGITLGLAWTYSAMMGAALIPDSPLAMTLFVPVVGPFVEVGIFTYQHRLEDPLGPALLDMALLIDGLVQTAGLVLVLVGATAPATRLVKDGAVEAHVAPMMLGGGGAGIGVLGRF